MNKSFGQIIRQLRRDRNLTQEELAEQLNISAQAVSKWENDISLPDISQLVPIANFFDVTTDALLGHNFSETSDDIRELLEEIYRLHDNCQDGEEGPTAVTILNKYREGIRQYPGNTNLLTEAIAFAGMIVSGYESAMVPLIGEDGFAELSREVEHWSELVIKYASSTEDVLYAKKSLIQIKIRKKNWAGAREMIDTLPREISSLRGGQLADLAHASGNTEEETDLRCRNIVDYAEALFYQTAALGNLYMNKGSYNDALYCYTFLRRMLDAMYRDEKYRPPFVFNEFTLYRFPAYCLMKTGKYDEAAALLEEGSEYLLTQAEYFNKKTELDIPLLRGRTFGYGYDGDVKYVHLAEKLRDLVCSNDFLPLRGNAQYDALVEKYGSRRD